MKNILLILFVLGFSFQVQASWKMRSVYKPVPDTEVQRSVLYFTSGEVTKSYAPVEPPFGMVSHKKYTTVHGEFFLTGWSQGARSTLFRVFDMSKDDAVLVCAITSFGESSSIRVDRGVLYIESIGESLDAEVEWAPCARVSAYRETVPSKPLAQ